MTPTGFSTRSGSSTHASAKQKNGTSKALSCYSNAIVLSRLLVNPRQHNSSTCGHSLYLAVKPPHTAHRDLSLSQAMNKGQHNVNILKNTGNTPDTPRLSCSIRCGPQQPASQVKVKALCRLFRIFFFPQCLFPSVLEHTNKGAPAAHFICVLLNRPQSCLLIAQHSI